MKGGFKHRLLSPYTVTDHSSTATPDHATALNHDGHPYANLESSSLIPIGKLDERSNSARSLPVSFGVTLPPLVGNEPRYAH